MTEEESKTKWCPMARPDDNAQSRIDVSNGFHSQSKCIASDCMMWVWDTSPSLRVDGHCGLAK